MKKWMNKQINKQKKLGAWEEKKKENNDTHKYVQRNIITMNWMKEYTKNNWPIRPTAWRSTLVSLWNAE